MANLTAPPPSSLLRRLLPPSLPHPPHLRLRLRHRPHRLSFVCAARRKPRKPRRDDAVKPTPPDLESQIYDFMQLSPNPDAFPTKQDLLAAGRGDLVRAISTQGGWMALGWDLEGESSGGSDGASCSGRPMEVEEKEGVGVEGMLRRLEKERKAGWRRKGEGGGNGRVSRRIPEHDPGDSDTSDTRSPTSDMWRKWSLQRVESPANSFEAAEIVPSKDIGKLEEHLSRNVSIIDENAIDKKANCMDTGDGRNAPNFSSKKSSKNQIDRCLQQLELKLSSVRNVLRSKTNGVASFEGQQSSLKELHMLSDALEFQETEIMNARDKLRSTRAKIAVLEGKMALQFIEAEKRMTEKERRLDAAKKTLLLLRPTCIFWANSASEVLLVGSFDGWTSQRRMDRSSTGVFSLCLKLYPGRYEFKFIVDGVWSVDPLRPTVCNNGHENNLIIVI